MARPLPSLPPPSTPLPPRVVRCTGRTGATDPASPTPPAIAAPIALPGPEAEVALPLPARDEYLVEPRADLGRQALALPARSLVDALAAWLGSVARMAGLGRVFLRKRRQRLPVAPARLPGAARPARQATLDGQREANAQLRRKLEALNAGRD